MDQPPRKLAYGLSFPDDPRVMTGRRKRQLRDGRLAGAAIRTALRLSDSDDRVLELWSGFGLISALLALRLGIRSIHTVEPAQPLVDYAQALHRDNGVETVTATCGLPGLRKGKGTLYLRGDLLAVAAEDDGAERAEVPVLNTAHLLRDTAPTVLIGDFSQAPPGLFDSADLTGLRLAIVTLPPQSAGPAVTATLFQAMGAGGLTYAPKQSSGRVVTFRRDW